MLSLTENLSFSHRRTQKNRTHKVQKDDGPSPFPSPKGRGVITEIPLWLIINT